MSEDQKTMAEKLYNEGLQESISNGYTSFKAIRLYKKAAKLGNIDAMEELSSHYRKNNEKKSYEWLLKAAEAGRPESQFKLYWYYREGFKCAPDRAEALSWCRKAAENGSAKAMYELSEIYDEGKITSSDRFPGGSAAVSGSPGGLHTRFYQGEGDGTARQRL